MEGGREKRICTRGLAFETSTKHDLFEDILTEACKIHVSSNIFGRL